MNKQKLLRYISIQENGCWHWLRSTTPNGYGKCWHEGALIGAHVASFILFKGEIPPNNIIRHRCNNRICVNPEHLVAGTYFDNLQDALEANGRIGRLPQFEEERVNEIFLLRKQRASVKEISNKTAFSESYIIQCISGNIRKDLLEKFEVEHGKLEQFNIAHKYSEENREDMRMLYKQGLSTGEIARLYGTGYKYIWKLVNKPQKKELKELSLEDITF